MWVTGEQQVITWQKITGQVLGEGTGKQVGKTVTGSSGRWSGREKKDSDWTGHSLSIPA